MLSFAKSPHDSQAMLDAVNDLLLSSSELEQLKTGVSNIITGTMQTDFAELRLLQDRTKTGQPLLRTLMNSRRGEVLTEALDKTKEGELRHLLEHANVALAIRLQATPEPLGYMVLGRKRQGSPYSPDDRRALAEVARKVALGLQNARRFKELQNVNTNLQEKVDALSRKLQRANERLKTMDETKDDFISMASHQLRTPLTSVKGYISMILEGDAGKITPVQHKMLQQAFFSSQQMVFLIADLLNVSRLRTGKFVIQQTPVNLTQMIDEELSQLKEAAKLHSVSLDFHPPKDFPELLLDETKIRQVIMNYIDNAIYYTPAKGSIDIRLIDKGSSVECRVIDSGIGVPKSDQPHLFTKFYRAANARKARPDGTGLGLYMARKIIVAQGGSTIFESKEGKGSTFGFSFAKTKLKAAKHKP